MEVFVCTVIASRQGNQYAFSPSERWREEGAEQERTSTLKVLIIGTSRIADVGNWQVVDTNCTS